MSEIRIGEGAVEDESIDNEDMLGAVEGAGDSSQEHGREVGHGAEMLGWMSGKSGVCDATMQMLASSVVVW